MKLANKGMFRVAKKRCDQCLFSNAKIVSDERRDEILEGCRELANEKHFVCHKFSMVDEEVCCRAFYDDNPMATQLMQVAARLGFVEFVDEEAKETS